MAVKKKVKAKSSSKEIALPWQKQLMAHLEKVAPAVETAATGKFISTKGGNFSLGGISMGREFDAVIVDWCYENSYYDKAFLEGEANVPVCFAVARTEEDLKPDSESPIMQSEDCAGCDLNEWGTAKNGGRGKACTNRRKLALVVEGGGGEIKMLRIAPTSIASWKSFVTKINKMGMHTMQCKVRLSFDNDTTLKGMPLKFEFLEEITNEKSLSALVETLDEAAILLGQPYDTSGYKVEKLKKPVKRIRKKSSFS